MGRGWVRRAVALALAAASLAAGLVSGQDAAIVAELTALETAWNRAHMTGDAAALDALWDRDVSITVPGMAPIARADALALLTSARMRFDRYETDGLEFRVHGDAAVVTGRLERVRIVEGRPVTDRWMFTKVYVRREDRWKVVAFHASSAG